MHIGGKLLNVGNRLANLVRDIRCGGQVRIAKPIVPDPALFIGICEAASLERIHRLEGFTHGRRHSLEKCVVEPHSTDVEREYGGRNATKIALMPLPEIC